MKKQYLLAVAATLVTVGLFTATVTGQTIVTQQWSMRTFSPMHGQDRPCGVACDSAGYIYVAGIGCGRHPYSNDYTLVKFAPDGALLWTGIYDSGAYDAPLAMTMDAAANVYVTGESGGFPNYDFATVKFNSQGQQQWVARYNSPNNAEDVAVALTLDNAGNVYVTGYSDPPWDFVTIKYNAQGVQQWVTIYNGIGNGYDWAVDLAVDGMGNVYVTGVSDGDGSSTTNYNYTTIKYNPQGVQQWVAWYDNVNHSSDKPVALVLDEQANVYVTGEGEDYLTTIKYDSSGSQLWIAQYEDPNYTSAAAADLELDDQGNVIIAGCVGNFMTPQSFLTLKYTDEGLLQWDRHYCGPDTWENYANALTLDSVGNIYVTGQIGNYLLWTGHHDCATLKYDPQGNLEWSAKYGTSDNYESGIDVTLDYAGNVIVAGAFTYGGQADNDFLTLKYNQIPGNVIVGMIPTVIPIQIPSGGGHFRYHLMAINNVFDSLAVDFWWQVTFPNQRVAFLDSLQMILPLDSLSIIRTQNVPANAPSGTYQYIVFAGDYPGIIWASDTLQFTKLASGNGPLVDGWLDTSEDFDGGTRFMASLSGSGPEGGLCSATPTTDVSPNPFNATTVLSYELRAASYISLKVYDTAGRLVTTLVEGWRETGEHQVTFDGSNLASGIYLAKFVLSGSGPEGGLGSTTSTTEVQKLVLMK